MALFTTASIIKLEFFVDYYTPQSLDDVPWNEMSIHVRDKLMPFFRLMKDINLLYQGELEIMDEQGEVLKYKGSVYNGKAFGDGVCTKVEEYTESAALGMEV